MKQLPSFFRNRKRRLLYDILYYDRTTSTSDFLSGADIPNSTFYGWRKSTTPIKKKAETKTRQSRMQRTAHCPPSTIMIRCILTAKPHTTTKSRHWMIPLAAICIYTVLRQKRRTPVRSAQHPCGTDHFYPLRYDDNAFQYAKQPFRAKL